MFGNIENIVNVCQDRLVYIQPEGVSQWLRPICEIECGIEVGIAGISATTGEETATTASNLATDTARLAGVGRVYKSHDTTLLGGFVFDVALQLPEPPPNLLGCLLEA